MDVCNRIRRYFILIFIIAMSLVFFIAMSRSKSRDELKSLDKFEKEENRETQETAQKKAMKKRAERVIKARDKLMRKKGAKVYRVGDRKIIKVQGTVRPDPEHKPLRKTEKPLKKSNKEEESLENEKCRAERKYQELKPEKVIVEDEVENFIYKDPEGYVEDMSDSYDNESEKEHKSETKKEDGSSDESEVNNDKDSHLITLNNNLQYDIKRDVYILWVTPVPEK